jgi:hypothetical protein
VNGCGIDTINLAAKASFGARSRAAFTRKNQSDPATTPSKLRTALGGTRLGDCNLVQV